jgi:hypothetical protein
VTRANGTKTTAKPETLRESKLFTPGGDESPFDGTAGQEDTVERGRSHEAKRVAPSGGRDSGEEPPDDLPRHVRQPKSLPLKR